MQYKWIAALIGVMGLFMAVLDNTVVSVALPQMQRAFSISNYDTVTWVATAYFLAQAAVIPVTGYFNDLFGSKVVFVTSLILFTLGSLMCAFAPNFGFLIAFRIFQGIGGGALFPTVFSMIFRIFPPTERGPASAVVGVPILLAPAFGPTIGGFLTTTFDWSAIFTVNIPIGIVAVFLAVRFLKGREDDFVTYGRPLSPTKHFDALGLILSMTGFTTLVYGLTEAGIKGWGDQTVDTFLIIGAILLIIFTFVELRSDDPVLDVHLFGDYNFTVASILTWALGAFLFGSLFLLPYFFENVLNYSALSTGEIFILQGLFAAVGVVVSGRLYNVVGPRTLAFFGLAFVTVATIGLRDVSLSTTGASLQGWLVLRGIGLGMTNTPLQTIALSRISNKAMARATSLLSVTRQVFSSIGVAGLTTYLTQKITNHATTIGNQVATGFASRPPTGVAAKCIAQVGRQGSTAIKQCAQTYVVQHASVNGLNDTFTMVMIGCGIAAIFALVLGSDPNIAQAKAAKLRGESIEATPALMGE